MEAAHTGGTITVDTAHDERHPDFSSLARRRGVGHSLSVALPTPDRTVGALNVYGGIQAFSEQDVELVARLRQLRGGRHGQRRLVRHRCRRRHGLLQTAMDSRALIEPGQGPDHGPARVHRRRGLRVLARDLAAIQRQDPRHLPIRGQRRHRPRPRAIRDLVPQRDDNGTSGPAATAGWRSPLPKRVRVGWRYLTHDGDADDDREPGGERDGSP